MEKWVDIKGYEGLYMVSSLGRIKSLPRRNVPTERILKINTGSSGYGIISLNKNGKGTTHNIHKLVAIAFLDHKPNGYELVVDHIDEDKTNNHVSNLRLINHRKNITRNLKKRSSRFIGVTWHTRDLIWQARIRNKDKSYHLGYFTHEVLAALAYQKAKIRFGD